MAKELLVKLVYARYMHLLPTCHIPPHDQLRPHSSSGDDFFSLCPVVADVNAEETSAT